MTIYLQSWLVYSTHHFLWTVLRSLKIYGHFLLQPEQSSSLSNYTITRLQKHTDTITKGTGSLFFTCVYLSRQFVKVCVK